MAIQINADFLGFLEKIVYFNFFFPKHPIFKADSFFFFQSQPVFFFILVITNKKKQKTTTITLI